MQQPAPPRQQDASAVFSQQLALLFSGDFAVAVLAEPQHAAPFLQHAAPSAQHDIAADFSPFFIFIMGHLSPAQQEAPSLQHSAPSEQQHPRHGQSVYPMNPGVEREEGPMPAGMALEATAEASRLDIRM